MARVPLQKELVNSRLLKEYASWVYCTGCQKTVAYLCYVTYDDCHFTYTCACGSEGQVHIVFGEAGGGTASDEPLVAIKNRLCCPKDRSPLITFVDKNLVCYESSIVCKTCNTRYVTSNNPWVRTE